MKTSPNFMLFIQECCEKFVLRSMSKRCDAILNNGYLLGKRVKENILEFLWEILLVADPSFQPNSGSIYVNSMKNVSNVNLRFITIH